MNFEQTVRLYPLTYQKEGEEVLVGRFGSDTFVVFPKDGAELLQRIEAGMTLSAAAAWYEETYADDVDMVDLLETLHALEFVRGDEEDLQPAQVMKEIPGQRVGRWLFSPLAWLLYGALAVVCAVCMIRYPVLRVQYRNVFFSPYLIVITLVLFFGQFPGLLFHEGFHFLAGRRIGLPTRLGFGRRMYFFVFETSLPGIWGLPRKQRLLPILAGMLADVLWFSMLTLAAGWLLPLAGLWSTVGGACLALAYSTALRFVWQFYFYLQTDIYYLCTMLLGCVNLQETTRQYLRNAVYRRLGKTGKLFDETEWVKRDRQVARWYVYLYVSGWLFTAALFVFAMLPVLWKVLLQVVGQLTSGARGATYWDSLAFLILTGGQYLVVLFIYLLERRQKKRQREMVQAV